jgi:hypothetical protein
MADPTYKNEDGSGSTGVLAPKQASNFPYVLVGALVLALVVAAGVIYAVLK